MVNKQMKLVRDDEIPVFIAARKTNFLEYFSYFESKSLRVDLLNRIEQRQLDRKKGR